MTLLRGLIAAAAFIGWQSGELRAESISASTVEAKTEPTPIGSIDHKIDTPADVLSAEEWERVDSAVERALEWLSTRQRPDGSFDTLDTGQPAVTNLCMMAYLSHGHVPGHGRYGALLDRATQYVLACQKRNGLVALIAPEGTRISA